MHTLPKGAASLLRLLLIAVAVCALWRAPEASAACPTEGPDTCVIDEQCRDQGEVNSDNACEVCDPARDAEGWSPRSFGATCDDANVCTVNDQCDGAGACAGVPVVGPGCETLPQGARCVRGDQCQSGACVDGFCCSATCAAGCMGCSNVLTGQADGTCAPIRAGTDPKSNCADAGASTCGRDGMCDGAGQCRRYEAGTVCAATACVEGTNGFLGQGTCTTDGVCQRAAATTCGFYQCNAGACGTACTRDRDCAPGAWCDRASSQCQGTNRPPVAAVGAALTVDARARVALDGSASSDPDLNALTYQWRQTDGEPKVVIDNGASAVATFIAPQVSAEAQLSFELTVSDGQATATATTTVRVRPPVQNLQPTAAISAPSVVKPGEAVLVGGTNSRDPEGAPLSYTWTVAGSASNPAGTASPLLTFTVPEDAPEGAITVTLTVNDGSLNSDPVSATIQVKPDPTTDDCACAATRAPTTTPRHGVSALALGLCALAFSVRRRRAPRV